jgi:hypothetical protein
MSIAFIVRILPFIVCGIVYAVFCVFCMMCDVCCVLWLTVVQLPTVKTHMQLK